MAQTTINLSTKPAGQYSLELWEYQIDSDSFKFKNKLQMNQEGSLKFRIPDAPNLYRIMYKGKGIDFINENSQSMDILIDFNTNTFPPITVKGSEATNHYKDYLLNVSSLQKQYLYPLEAKMKAALESKDQSRINAVEEEHQKNLEIFASTLYNQMTGMGSSLALYAIIRTLDFNRYLPYIENLAQPFIKDRPESPFAIKLDEMITSAKRIQVGGTAPNFTLNRYDNDKSLSLSDFRGGIVLIDFWAAWCLPCIKENIEFKKIYGTYHSKGFDIWGLSLDKKETAWRKTIEKHQFPWKHSWLENESVKTLYKVVALPTNFLIDAQGKIIARNITALKLEEILDNMYH